MPLDRLGAFDAGFAAEWLAMSRGRVLRGPRRMAARHGSFHELFGANRVVPEENSL